MRNIFQILWFFQKTSTLLIFNTVTKGGFKSEDTGEFLHLQHKYSKSLSIAEKLNFPPKTVNSLFKFHAQDSELEYFCWRR